MIAYDGSELARTSIRRAAELFPSRPAVVVTVWEPGLALMPVGAPDGMGMTNTPPDPEVIDAVDRAQHEHAETVAEDGAELARAGGLAAEARAVPEARDPADTLLEIARDLGAAVVVVGSHGITGLRTRLLGRVSRKLIEHSDRPVLVIRHEDPPDAA